ncbi:MAG: cyclophilin-like fold protein [Verrucomicrobiota bacterium]
MSNIILPLALIGMVLGGTLSALQAKDPGKGKTQNQMQITIGQKTFKATLEDNVTAAAFKAMLPLKLNMDDVNDNEKVSGLSANLPTEDSNPKHIQTGDLMIWASRSLVLFYKSFPTSYSYTRLGRIHDPAGLFAAVGSGNVTVTFKLEPER